MVSKSCESTCPSHHSRVIISCAMAWFGRVKTNFMRWYQLAQQRSQLRALDSDALKDIGISNADVHRITRRRFWDDPIKSNVPVDERYRYGGKP